MFWDTINIFKYLINVTETEEDDGGFDSRRSV